MYQYIRIEKERNRFFCLEQSLVSLAWFLLFKKDIVRPILRKDPNGLSFGVARNWFRKRVLFFRKNFFLIVIFASRKYHVRQNHTVFQFPFFGQICLPVHKGYKIFDLRKGVVVKIFDSDVKVSVITSEIEQLKKISSIEFAPSLRRWNVEGRWLEEEYICGSLDSSYVPLDSEALLRRFCLDLVPQIRSLILSQPLVLRNAAEYAENTIEIFKASRLAKQQARVREYTTIKKFLDSMMELLWMEGNASIFLVFTHGDYCPANMLNTKEGIKIIDWEGAGYRSALFDVYSYYFYRPVSRRVPATTLVSELNEAMPFFISSLDKKAVEISGSLRKLEKVYRRVYYVEQVCKEVDREGTDKNLNIMANILGYITVFNEYEEIMASTFELASKPQN